MCSKIPETNLNFEEIKNQLGQLGKYLTPAQLEAFANNSGIDINDMLKDPSKYQKQFANILDPVDKDRSFGVALCLLASGLFIAYMGIRLFTPFLAVSGMIVGGGTFYFVYQKIIASFPTLIPAWEYTPHAVFAVGGVLGSVLFIKAWSLGTYALSAYGGVNLAILVKALTSGHEISDGIDRNLLMAVFAILGLVLARFIRDIVIICTSALSGAFLIFLGLDTLKDVKFREFIQQIITCNENQLKSKILESFKGEIGYCLYGIIFVTVTGIYVQFRSSRKSNDD